MAISNIGLPKPSTQDELQTLIQNAASNGGGLCLDPSTKINLNKTLSINLKDVSDNGVYINGNGARLTSTIRDGKTPAVQFIGTTRFLSVENFTLYGGSYDTPGCGNGWEFIAKGGDIYCSTFRNLVSAWCGGDGFRFQGAVFESDIYSLKAKDCRGNGVSFSNDGGVISNIMMYGANFSRCWKYGMALLDGANSVDVYGGSFVLNGAGGILAPNGIRMVHGINGENTGETLIEIPWSAYKSTITACNLSSNGRTVNQQAGNAKPSRWVISYNGTASNLQRRDNYVTPYSESSEYKAPTNMGVLAPK